MSSGTEVRGECPFKVSSDVRETWWLPSGTLLTGQGPCTGTLKGQPGGASLTLGSREIITAYSEPAYNLPFKSISGKDRRNVHLITGFIFFCIVSFPIFLLQKMAASFQKEDAVEPLGTQDSIRRTLA